MTPADTANFWPLFLILGVPIIILAGGPYGWRFLVLLAALAGLAYAPLISLAASRALFPPLAAARLWRSRDHWPSWWALGEAHGSFQLARAGGTYARTMAVTAQMATRARSPASPWPPSTKLLPMARKPEPQ